MKHLLVIPAIFKPVSSHTECAGLDSGLKTAGMTVWRHIGRRLTTSSQYRFIWDFTLIRDEPEIRALETMAAAITGDDLDDLG